MRVLEEHYNISTKPLDAQDMIRVPYYKSNIDRWHVVDLHEFREDYPQALAESYGGKQGWWRFGDRMDHATLLISGCAYTRGKRVKNVQWVDRKLRSVFVLLYRYINGYPNPCNLFSRIYKLKPNMQKSFFGMKTKAVDGKSIHRFRG